MLPSSLTLPHLRNFLLPLPVPDRISRFRVRFRFQSPSSNCFRFLLPLPASAPTSLLSMKQLIVFSVKNKKQASLLCKLFDLTCVVEGMVWNGRRFSIFHTGNFLPFCFYSILKIFHSIFHLIVKFSSIFHSILPHQRNFRVEVMQRIFCCFNCIFAMS